MRSADVVADAVVLTAIYRGLDRILPQQEAPRAGAPPARRRVIAYSSRRPSSLGRDNKQSGMTLSIHLNSPEPLIK
ncbi:hypothetical protein EVAR_21136_1 [Eumeta japonica]|uniref:Uncharacterized protein n=1 Tax=Eumeta variegata TaxID=151549 RepID=A0A4C1VUT4_EUMVA|nr:hypothetical protein EVAR_21136_1 [Eumeta japonica]